MSIPSVQILVSKYHSSKEAVFLGEKGDAGVEAGKIQDKPVMSYAIKQETAPKNDRDTSNDRGGGLKGLPLAKAGTVWALE